MKECSVCGSTDLECLGRLGNLYWFRCQECHTDIPDEETSLTGPEVNQDEWWPDELDPAPEDAEVGDDEQWPAGFDPIQEDEERWVPVEEGELRWEPADVDSISRLYPE